MSDSEEYDTEMLHCPNCHKEEAVPEDDYNLRCDNPNCRVVLFRSKEAHEDTTMQCQYLNCTREAEKIVWFEKMGEDGKEMYFCTDHGRQEVRKHEDAVIQEDCNV